MCDFLTDWFPPDVKPVHIGIYRTRMFTHYTDGVPQYGNEGLSHWDGARWGNTARYDTPIPYEELSGADQNKMWRGIASGPIQLDPDLPY